MKAFISILLASIAVSCVKQPTQQATTPTCEFPNSKYPVQSVSHNTETGTYSLFLLEAPSCLKQPITVSDLKLSRLDDNEKEKAILEWLGESGSILHMQQNFTIQLVQSTNGNSQTPSQSSSSWAPFLASAAGAAVGGMVVNSLFNKPKYYTPPSPEAVAQAKGSVVTGYGGSGESRSEAIQSYQRKYPGASPIARSDKTTNSNFFKKSDAPKASHNTTILKRNPSAKPRGFFKSKRR